MKELMDSHRMHGGEISLYQEKLDNGEYGYEILIEDHNERKVSLYFTDEKKAKMTFESLLSVIDVDILTY